MNILADIVVRTQTHSALGGDDLVRAVIWLVAIGLICWLLWWFIDYAKVPEPFNKVARILIALIAVVFLIRFVISIAGSPW